MKQLLLITCLLLTSYSLFAQTGDGTTTRSVIMKGSDVNIITANFKITDSKIYDTAGNVIDSSEAVKMVRTFEYQISFSRKKGEGEFKRTIKKIDPIVQASIDARVKDMNKPKSMKLREGVILDLKPIYKYIDREELEGKAVVLIFWCNGCYAGTKPDAYATVNDVLSTYMNPDKLVILPITHHMVNVASQALIKSPIVNTKHILNAGDLTKFYETNNRPVIVLADKDHKIVYSIINNAEMTPRLLNKSLKEIL